MTNPVRQFAALCVLCAALHAGPSAADRFRLAAAQGAPALARQLAAAVGDGYRVVAATQGVAINGKDRIVVLLERTVDAADYAYVVVRTSGDFDEPIDGKSVNQWAAEGYRFSRDSLLTRRVEDWWVPESAAREPLTLLLERPPDPSPVRYTSLRVTSRKDVRQDLADLRLAGRRVVGMWNAGRIVRVMVEETLAEPTEPRATPADTEPFRLLIGTNRLGFEPALERAARRGYRILEFMDQSIQAPPIVLLKRVPRAEPVDIQVLFNVDRKIHRGKLEKKLNKKARRGYRVAARTVTPSVLAFEREAGRPARVSYRAISSKEPPGLPRALAAAVDAGYRVVTLLTNADETIAVVERDVPGGD